MSDYSFASQKSEGGASESGLQREDWRPGASGIAPVSVLMSTYQKESASNLRASLESVFSQTLRPAQMVLVVDGAVGDDQMAVIDEYRDDPRIPVVTILELDRQHGLAGALSAGTEQCTQPYVMRMDSDDLCVPHRLEMQWRYIQVNPDVDLVGTWCHEFRTDHNECEFVKTAPASHEEVVRALRWRNVLCHPTILVRRDRLVAVGGYRTDYAYLEDYDLYVRLANAGARFHVIPEPLVKVRATLQQRKRRGGLSYVAGELRFRTFCLRSGFIGISDYLASISAYTAFRLMPASVKDALYRMVREPQKQAAPAGQGLMPQRLGMKEN
ncbi:glycosyltransferase [Azospirillum sp. sgz302134]